LQLAARPDSFTNHRETPMVFGVTGNTDKEKLWEPAARTIRWMQSQGVSACVTRRVASGLAGRDLLPGDVCQQLAVDDLAASADLILSFGGDGTFLHTAAEAGASETPILGVNIGRLGFLAEVEVADIEDAIRSVIRGEHTIEDRACIEATAETDGLRDRHIALNEIVIERSGRAGLISVDVHVDDEYLHEYWADGIILSTPTGSTAYSLSVGGPIVWPTADVFVLAAIASHSLTVRPLVLENRSTVRATIDTSRQPFVLAADGRSTEYTTGSVTVTMRLAAHPVRVVRLPDHHHFRTLRNKLMWGASKGE
jgi:NAD+ kinase